MLQLGLSNHSKYIVKQIHHIVLLCGTYRNYAAHFSIDCECEDNHISKMITQCQDIWRLQYSIEILSKYRRGPWIIQRYNKLVGMGDIQGRYS